MSVFSGGVLELKPFRLSGKTFKFHPYKPLPPVEKGGAMIRFQGAQLADVKENGEREFRFREDVWLRCEAIIGYYDHAVLVSGHKIWVMETAEQIGRMVREHEQLR